MIAAPPLALYLHFPWCLSKCPYCDFNSRALPQGKAGEYSQQVYIDAVCRELSGLAAQLPLSFRERPLVSIFFGGGTPSLMAVLSLERLLNQVHRFFCLAGDCEITLEANPGAQDNQRLKEFVSAGVNRISLGVQSFNDHLLSSIGRIHDAAVARRAIDLALRYAPRVNLDLMYALPGQTLEQVAQDIRAATSSGAGHISFYQLTVEPATAFYHALPPNLPDHDLGADMQELVTSTLGAAGFFQYEVAAYAKDNQQCQHNLNYWQFGDYLAVGAGAHGKLTLDGTVYRYANQDAISRYSATAAAPRSLVAVGQHELTLEFMMNALRLNSGFTTALFEQRTGLGYSSIAAIVNQAIAEGLLKRDGTQISPTRYGQHMLNSLLHKFSP